MNQAAAPYRLLSRRIERVLGPEKKPNEYGRRKRLTWHMDHGLGAVIIDEMVPAHVGILPGIVEVDRVLIPITAVTQEYGLYDVINRNRREFQGQSAAGALQKNRDAEQKENDYALQEIKDEFMEDYRKLEKGRLVFGPRK